MSTVTATTVELTSATPSASPASFELLADEITARPVFTESSEFSDCDDEDDESAPDDDESFEPHAANVAATTVMLNKSANSFFMFFLQKIFLFYNKLMGSRESVIADCKLMCEALSDFTAIDTGIEKVKGEIENITQLVQACVQENASSAQSQERYEKRYKGLIDKYDNTTAILNTSIQKRTTQENQIKAITSFIKSLQTQPLILNEWDDTIFTVLVNKCIVHKDGYITFEFNSGNKIKVKS